MSLMSYHVHASIAVSDIARARQSYEGTLGLSEGIDHADGSRIYACQGGTSVHIYPSQSSAGQTVGTLATWHVADLSALSISSALSTPSFRVARASSEARELRWRVLQRATVRAGNTSQ